MEKFLWQKELAHEDQGNHNVWGPILSKHDLYDAYSLPDLAGVASQRG